MGRELQKRKRRSSRAKVTMPNRRKKALNPLGNDTIAKHWNKKETLSQNYTRFGLVAKLGKTTGGTAPSNKSNLSTTTASSGPNSTGTTDPLAVHSADQGLLHIREVRVERDASGRITRVLRDANPLVDPLNEFDSDSDSDSEERKKVEAEKQRRYEEWSGFAEDGDRPEVVRALEREANRPTEKTVRRQSTREVEWLRRLVERHGANTGAMARDVRLNPMQQTAADIGRRLRKAGLLEA
ncbi:ribosome biogenesis protein Nop16 [Staphylotrichum tortipilum]|uniref:Nucleolar protein 16 n=1 Tax=Staphylotrichum tortipilum TaxID=2831512 RepID=A0AAN6MR13_9PEZI|nr:ribosome biogenesis protein Nop16 [Staphylotrichum longicolle]